MKPLKVWFSFLFHKKRIHLLDKRQRFAIQTILLTFGIIATQLVWEDYRFFMVGILSVATFFMTAWSLSEDVEGIEWILLFILPVLFTAAVSLFYFLLPPRMIVRLILTVIFAIGSYAILLVENIYNVAAERSIQLLRAAQSVGMLATLIVIFLFASIFYALRLPFLLNMLIFFLSSFLLSIQSFWSVRLDTAISKKILLLSILVGLGIGELVLALSFWPVDNASYALLVSSFYYCLVGILQLHLADRLFGNSYREFLLVFIFTFLLTFFTTHWG